MPLELSHNRLWNTKNINQGPQKRVLALCSAGLLRSPTVAWVLSNDPYNYNTRAAGVASEYALIALDPYLIEWADEIVCVEVRITEQFRNYLAEHSIDLGRKQIVTLEIPDCYERRHPRLVAAIKKQYADWIHAADKE